MSFRGKPAGMEVFTGRVRGKEDFIGFVLMSNNIIRGAAGGSIANAELFLKLRGGSI
jgi:aspartate-semialdehyde dehydrogenase